MTDSRRAEATRPHDLRLLGPAGGAWAGAAVGGLAWLPAVWWLVAGSLITGVTCRRRPALAAALALLAGGLAAAAIGRQARAAGPVADLAEHGSGARVELRLTGDPQLLPPQPHLPASVIVTARLERLTAAGKHWRTRSPVVVIAPAGSWSSLLPSTRVSVAADFRSAQGDDVAALLLARGPPEVISPPSALQRWAGHVRAGLRTAARGLPTSERGLLPGLVLGDTSGMPAADVEAFTAAGLSHLTAVSGANVAIVVGVVYAILRWTPLGVRGRSAVSAVAVLGFVILVRPSPSVLRAGAMGLLALLAIGLGRPRALVPALLAVVIGFALFAPTVVTQAGFALSVLATGAILMIAPWWTQAITSRLPARCVRSAPVWLSRSQRKRCARRSSSASEAR